MKITKSKNGTITMTRTKGDKPGILLDFVRAMADNAKEKQEDKKKADGKGKEGTEVL